MAKKTGGDGKKAELKRLLKDIPRDDVWQADVFPAPMPVQDGKEVGFPPAAMVVHPSSRFILAIEIFPLGHDLAVCMGEALLAAMRKYDRMPVEVHVRSRDWAELLAPTAELLGFRFAVDSKLKELTQTRRDMAKAMKSRTAPRGTWGEA